MLFSIYRDICKDAGKCYFYGVFWETAGKRHGVFNEVRLMTDAGRQANATL